MAHQHLGLAEIQGLAGLGELFDTLFVFENYPLDRGSLAADAGGLRLSDFGGRDATHYPLSLAAAPGERLQLRLGYRPDLFERASVEALAGRLVRLLEAAVDGCRSSRSARSTFSPAEERATILRGVERHRAGDPVRHAAGAVRGAGRRRPRMRPRWCSRIRA